MLSETFGGLAPIVCVDSGSTDASIEHAREHGVEVVELDISLPLTAARARNAGFGRLRQLAPHLAFVIFVDRDCDCDCQVNPEWLRAAEEFLDQHAPYGVVCGRRRERFPDASFYNYLCDIELNTAVGDADGCGGDAMMRVEAFAGVGGFNPSLG